MNKQNTYLASKPRYEILDEMAHHIAVNEGLENAYAPLTEQDIKEILVASL